MGTKTTEWTFQAAKSAISHEKTWICIRPDKTKQGEQGDPLELCKKIELDYIYKWY